MDELAEFNRQDWADVPYVIQLRGGYYDGRTYRLRELRDIWRVPEPAPLNPSLLDLEARAVQMTARMEVPVSDYRRTGEVTDDGRHIYRFAGREC